MNIRFIKPMSLNRNGKVIGQLVKFLYKGKWIWGYYSPRTPGHYFIKHRGFGINHDVLLNLYDQWKIDWVIIHYKGVKREKYLLSNIEKDWFPSNIRVEYSKEFDDHMESYSYQVILPESKMVEV